MCGIIGVVGPKKQNVWSATYALLKQSEIRGKHASGLSYFKNGQLITNKYNVPAGVFVNEYMPDAVGNYVIGHTRYSTSDIKYNQPLQEGSTALVHNGVITQAPFEQWKQLYNVEDFATKNDSEILLKYIIQTRKIDFANSSIAAGFIHLGEMWAFRNGQRPLYLFALQGLVGFASTANIIKRAFIGQDVQIIKANTNLIYNFYIDVKGNAAVASIKHYEEPITEQQLDTIRGTTYLKGGGISTGLQPAEKVI